MSIVTAYSPGKRLAWLAECLVRLDKPYLIAGAQATYQYHRWLTPLENLVVIQVYTADVPEWRRLTGDRCVVFEALPTTAQARAAQRAIVLEPILDSGRYRRRQIVDGLTFIAPEDLCLDLVEQARGETSPAEAAAILIARGEAIDWPTLLMLAGQRGLARRLGVLIEATSIEMGADLAPTWFVARLHQVAEAEPSMSQDYPSVRQHTAQMAYPSLAERWGVRLRLPHHVLGKVVFDLAMRSGAVLQSTGS